MTQNRPIIIVGGGLAGLATAHALAAFGLKAEVYEAASALGEIGAAVNASPNATRALEEIGLGEKIAAVGNSSPGIYTRNMQTGEYLEFRDRRATAARYKSPYYTFHRADLLDALASGLDTSAVHLGHRLVAIEERGNETLLTFANGATVAADVLVAADGVRSVVRQALYGDDNPTYTGQMVWRALLQGSDVPAEILEPTGHIQWVGPGCHLLAYYIRGTSLVNIVTQEDTDQWVAEGWSTRCDPDEIRRSFPNPEPRQEKLLSIVTDCSKWGSSPGRSPTTGAAVVFSSSAMPPMPCCRMPGKAPARPSRIPISSRAGLPPKAIRQKPSATSAVSASRACTPCSACRWRTRVSSTCATAPSKRR